MVLTLLKLLSTLIFCGYLIQMIDRFFTPFNNQSSRQLKESLHNKKSQLDR